MALRRSGTYEDPEGFRQYTDGAQHGTLTTQLAGERNVGSASNGHIVTRDEANGTVVDVAVNDTQVSAAPAHLIGVYVNTALSAHEVLIRDGGVGGTILARIPASASAGDFFDFKGVRFETDLHVDPDDAGTGELLVMWRPI